MNENSDSQKTSISKASSLEEISDYWDNHSLSDHWDKTREVDFEVRAQRRHRITLKPEIYERLEEQARTRGVSPETLVNQWLSERLNTR
jgi:CopG antitoxin of type II toxin-antitoxin system